MAGPWFTVHRSKDDWQTMDTIWISNGDKNNRAVVQGRVLFEEPFSEVSEESSAQLNGSADVVATAYGDTTLGAGARLDDLDQLKFSTTNTAAFNVPQNDIVPAGSNKGKEATVTRNEPPINENRP